MMAELGFTRFDMVFHESSKHLKPSDVVQDVYRAAQLLRPGSGLCPGAFSLDLGPWEGPAAKSQPDDQARKTLHAVCQLARLSNVPLITISPGEWLRDGGTEPPTESQRQQTFEAEVKRLKPLLDLASSEGVILSLATQMGTLTEDPDMAVNLCKRLPGLVLTLDPSHYVAGPFQSDEFDQVYLYVRHVWLRDSGRTHDRLQVRVGQGEIEYGRIISQLARHRYERLLTVDIRDVPDAPYDVLAEVRKLKYLLESLV
jgi:sugar phosphate isomerase/epimerase